MELYVEWEGAATINKTSVHVCPMHLLRWRVEWNGGDIEDGFDIWLEEETSPGTWEKLNQEAADEGDTYAEFSTNKLCFKYGVHTIRAKVKYDHDIDEDENWKKSNECTVYITDMHVRETARPNNRIPRSDPRQPINARNKMLVWHNQSGGSPVDEITFDMVKDSAFSTTMYYEITERVNWNTDIPMSSSFGGTSVSKTFNIAHDNYDWEFKVDYGPSYDKDCFGQKTLTLTHPDIPSGCNQDSQTIEIYYTRDAKNWPGADPNGGGYIPLGVSYPITPPYRFEKTNWYVYYDGTVADKDCLYDDAGSWCSPYDEPNYTPYVGWLESPFHDVVDINVGGVSVKNAGDRLYGIDIYAWASRHEMRHHLDYDDWWDVNGVIAADDLDGDRVPDILEPGFPASEGGPYDPNEIVSHLVFVGVGLDDQAICMFTQDDWDPNTHTDIDWAYPGSRWH